MIILNANFILQGLIVQIDNAENERQLKISISEPSLWTFENVDNSNEENHFLFGDFFFSWLSIISVIKPMVRKVIDPVPSIKSLNFFEFVFPISRIIAAGDIPERAAN
jgi:hypothetical protein